MVKFNFKIYSILSFPHHNSSPIQTRISKFGGEVQNTLVKVTIVCEVIDLDFQGLI